MKDHLRPIQGPLGRVASTALIATALSSAYAVAGLAAQAPVPGRALSFEVGEERQYRLGPYESLDTSESAEWRIALRSIVEDEGVLVANFEFSHDRFETIQGSFDPRGDLMNVRVRGQLRTNLAGFPLWLQYEQDFGVAGESFMGNGDRVIRYVWEPGGRFRKNVRADRRDYDFRVGVPKYEYMDFDGPRGLYVYLPTALECLGTERSTCVDQEPAFANPGFLSFMASALEEIEGSKREFMFFMPGSIGVSPFERLNPGSWLSRERNSVANMQRYFQTTKVELGASSEIDVGPKKLHAWEVDMCCGIDQVYIEPGGRVVRVNLDTTMTNAEDRYIRLVFPFEEFMTAPDPVLR